MLHPSLMCYENNRINFSLTGHDLVNNKRGYSILLIEI